MEEIVKSEMGLIQVLVSMPHKEYTALCRLQRLSSELFFQDAETANAKPGDIGRIRSLDDPSVAINIATMDMTYHWMTPEQRAMVDAGAHQLGGLGFALQVIEAS